MSREMKDSGIKWIGDIPKHWKVPKMNYICNTITDFVASGSFESLRINVPYLDSPDYAMLVRTTDLSGSARSEKRVYISKHSYDFLRNSNLFGGEIILPNIGAVGDVYIVPKGMYEKMSLAPNAIMFKSNYLDKFYFYYFYCMAGRQSILELCQSTAQAKFNKTQLRSVRVLLPPLAEQQKIADYLDKVCGETDDMIALQEKMIEELKAYKQSVITEAVTKGLNPNVPMRDSGIDWIGDIPEHWNISKLKNISLQSTIRGSKGIYIGLENIKSYSGVFIETDSKYNIDEALQCCGGDVLFGKLRPYLAKVHVVEDLSCCSGEFVVLNNSKCPRFLKFLLLSDWFIKIVDSSTYGTKMPRANPYFIMNMKIVVPPLSEQQAIADFLDKKCADIDALIAIKQQKIEELKDYKKSMIYEYVTGKKQVN